MKYKNIFITGSTGVVGKPIFLKLINQGHNVFALSRNTKNEDFIDFVKKQRLKVPIKKLSVKI